MVLVVSGSAKEANIQVQHRMCISIVHGAGNDSSNVILVTDSAKEVIIQVQPCLCISCVYALYSNSCMTEAMTDPRVGGRAAFIVLLILLL